jgi:hypothetical protein
MQGCLYFEKVSWAKSTYILKEITPGGGPRFESQKRGPIRIYLVTVLGTVRSRFWARFRIYLNLG